MNIFDFLTLKGRLIERFTECGRLDYVAQVYIAEGKLLKNLCAFNSLGFCVDNLENLIGKDETYRRIPYGKALYREVLRLKLAYWFQIEEFSEVESDLLKYQIEDLGG
jgi:hypothetical protein